MGSETNSLYPLYAAFEGFLSSLGKTAGVLNPIGMKLLMSIAIMLIIWKAIVTLLEGGGGRRIAANTIYVLMLTSFAAMMIDRLQFISDILIESTDTVANTVVDTRYMSNNHSKTAQLAVNTFAPLFGAAENIMKLEASAATPKKTTDPNPQCDETMANPDGYANPCLDSDGKIDSSVTGNGGGWFNILPIFGYLLSLLMMWLLSWFLKIMAMGILMIAGCVAMGHILISQVLVHVALTIGPIMIPFMIWESASYLFDGWLRFFIKALFHKIVGVIILATMGAGITAGVASFNSATAQSAMGAGLAFTVVGAAIMMGLAIMTLMLAAQIPNIADGLLSGSSRSGINLSPKMDIKAPPEPRQPKRQDVDEVKSSAPSKSASATPLPNNKTVSMKTAPSSTGSFRPKQ